MTFKTDMPASPSAEDTAGSTGARIAILVLGMHRTGTSAMSGVLARLGCDIPATPMVPDNWNTRGFYESQTISAFNNNVLSSAGIAWDEISGVGPAWFDSPRRATFTNEAVGLLESEFANSPLIVLKDPRISLLAPMWLDALRQAGYVVKVVLPYRSASAVASSLARRNGFNPALGRLLWLRYVLEAEFSSRGLPRVFVSYDRLLQNWEPEASRIADRLELHFPRWSSRAADEIEGFLTADMRHFTAPAGHAGEDAASHSWVAETQDILERWTRDEGTATDVQHLDAVRNTINYTFSAFDRIARSANASIKSEAKLKTQLREIEDTAKQSEAELKTQLAAATHSKVQAEATLNAELAALRADMTARGEALLTYEQRIDDLNQALATLSSAHVHLQTQTSNKMHVTQSELAEAKSKLGRAEVERKRIMNSTSMRITTPLRRVMSFIKRTSKT